MYIFCSPYASKFWIDPAEVWAAAGGAMLFISKNAPGHLLF